MEFCSKNSVALQHPQCDDIASGWHQHTGDSTSSLTKSRLKTHNIPSGLPEVHYEPLTSHLSEPRNPNTSSQGCQTPGETWVFLGISANPQRSILPEKNDVLESYLSKSFPDWVDSPRVSQPESSKPAQPPLLVATGDLAHQHVSNNKLQRPICGTVTE